MLSLNDPVFYAIGHTLDGIGELRPVALERSDGEGDQAYRERLISKLRWLSGERIKRPICSVDDYLEHRESLDKQTPIQIGGLTYRVQHVEIEMPRALGHADLVPLIPVDHEWSGPAHDGPTIPPIDDTKPLANHVRDAVEANR